MSGTTVVRAIMLVATIVWAWAEVLKIRRPGQGEPARRLWTVALALTLVHAALAFDVKYQWSHEAALMDTARRTVAVTGMVWGGGIFVNDLFLMLWLADALWWWIAPVAYVRRPVALERTRSVLFLFMFVNGAIVFASNIARVVGIPSVAAVCIAWVLDGRRHPARA
jgi:hypothetical protein